jgi:epoxyqueuosine reductase
MHTDHKQAIIEKTRDLGFAKVGFVKIPLELRQDFYFRWIQRGMHGEMHWMAQNPERRAFPEKLMPQAKTLIVVGMNYLQPEPERRGRIAKYALGRDYHKLIYKRLKNLCALLREWGGENRPYVDTGPLLEKPIAEQAGLGWQGKNTVLLNPEDGQWLFLGTVLTTLEFSPDTPQKDRCGSCTRCITVCPTQAITAPYQLDARKCISYLMIEHKGAIPLEFRRPIGNHLFGCDDCLDVCPWNRWAKITRESHFQPRDYPDLREMLKWDEATFDKATEGTPIRRLKRPRWLRNICVVLGNIGTPDDLPALRQATRDPDPLIHEHAQWAIDEIQNRLLNEHGNT